MHPKAADRLRQLVTEALGAVTVTGSREVDFEGLWELLRPFSGFIAREFARWIREDYSQVYVFFSIRNALRDHGLLQTAGKLAETTTTEQRLALVDSVCAYWASVPIPYEFRFPLPAAACYETDTPLAPGVVLSRSAEADWTPPALSAFSGLGFLSAASAAAGKGSSLTCLVVAEAGVMELLDETEAPASNAIRKAKIVLELATTEGIGNTRSLGASLSGDKPPETALTRTPPDLRRPLRLPHIFQAGIAGLVWRRDLKTYQQKAFVSDFDRIATVVRGYENWNRTGRTPGSKPRTPEDFADQQCARIATAAEWLFDARHATDSAITLVQTAIAFEALYPGRKQEKGEEPEPIVSILSNRIAYSLGKNAAGRENVRDLVAKFYGLRSSVVHSGGTSLSAEQRQVLYAAQSILRSALRHELDLASFVPAQ